MNNPEISSLGPYLSRLPTELVLEIVITYSSISQKDYASLLLTSRLLYDLCRLTCLPFVPIVLQTSLRTAQFADYLDIDDEIAPRVRRLWIMKDQHSIIPRCTNLTTLACDGHDLIPTISSNDFYHTQLTNLTIMGLWDFWLPFTNAKYGRVLCGQLDKLRLLDHLFLHNVDMKWLASLKELTYWSIEVRGGHSQFNSELSLLDALPTLQKLRILMRNPSSGVYGQLGRIIDRRLEVVAWGKQSEVTEWICQ
ncbi:hypothetical protein AGABI1DRAFT_113707 [Agaricus bisporus var. burnettii JB137-S8]|uniref:F-box domain-containing protein n=1 Tax=Agaricus bisporus var. burnettii (strain JB137-S8 / ATCC MYA-4627 / FGSC 10392) TaxID=597362 RepID=K5WUI8_AGABU|nr:uncharacterized protein AGABI1DRAFT_113707 [Agaricus bisporus var. burnettii JB137-S8]EKM79086.1 hypothetical protein AGABI1DRAFT_113707 [Agaricus bisporus var. burnettii JB137-S8]